MNQVKQLSYEEKIVMYMASSKEELIEMLIEANNLLNQLTSKAKSLDSSKPTTLDYNQMSKDFDSILASHDKEYLVKWLETDKNSQQTAYIGRIVSSEVAKLLKSKGFSNKCVFFYQDNDLSYSPKGVKHCKNGLPSNHKKYSAPTIAQAVKFLIELNNGK